MKAVQYMSARVMLQMTSRPATARAAPPHSVKYSPAIAGHQIEQIEDTHYFEDTHKFGTPGSRASSFLNRNARNLI